MLLFATQATGQTSASSMYLVSVTFSYKEYFPAEGTEHNVKDNSKWCEEDILYGI